MAGNPIEKKAQKLNQSLKDLGTGYGKKWRVRIRGLLKQTFEALQAKPLDGELCRALELKIDKELSDIENDTVDVESDGGDAVATGSLKQDGEKDSGRWEEKCERMPEGHSERPSKKIMFPMTKVLVEAVLVWMVANYTT